MNILRIIGGIVSLTLGILLCVPGGFLVWKSFPHTDFILSINFGAATLSGWQMWSVVVGLGVVGLLCLLLGFYLMFSTKDS